MTASELVADLRARGVRLSVADPDRLHVNAPESLATPELLETLRVRKADIIAELRRREEAQRRPSFHGLGRDPHAWRDFQDQVEERAAILEFDGGLSRDEANALSEVMTVDQWLN